VDQVTAMASSKVVVITGGSRGIGLGLVKEYASRGWQVVATCRNPEAAPQLKAIQDTTQQVKLLKCDINSDESIQTCVKAMGRSGVDRVDILINNAGVSNKDHPDDLASQTDREEMMSIFNTNVGGPLSVTNAMAKLLEASGEPLVINISSSLGSISSTNRFTTTSYQCSKAALNMLTRCQAAAFPKIKMLSVHPGWVQTDMGSAKNRQAPTSVEESVAGIANVADTAATRESGAFLDFKGEKLAF